MEDERTRLRKSLKDIQTATNVIQSIAFAQKTLEECYHTWLVDENKLKCPICGKTNEIK
jgi:rubrerythrin